MFEAIINLLSHKVTAIWVGTALTVAVADASAAELERNRISVGERNRSFLLYEPDTIEDDAGLRPLVLVFHGGGGTAKGFARQVGRQFHGIADREQFLIAYPDAVDKTWDFGAGVVSERLDERVDDQAFFAALIDHLIENNAVDRQLVFATGISRGGQASYFAACTLPERIRAIAPVAMPMPEFMQSICADVPATPVMVINGTRDPIVPYKGGQIKAGRQQRGNVLSTKKTIEFWRERNGCPKRPDERSKLDEIRRDRTKVIREQWTSCTAAPVTLVRVDGGGHTWPSGAQYLPRKVVGRVTREINGAEEIWSFFSGFVER